MLGTIELRVLALDTIRNGVRSAEEELVDRTRFNLGVYPSRVAGRLPPARRQVGSLVAIRETPLFGAWRMCFVDPCRRLSCLAGNMIHIFFKYLDDVIEWLDRRWNRVL